MISLFTEKEKQPTDSSRQQRGVEELNSSIRQLLASGTVDLDSRRAGGQLPKVSLAVIRDESVEPQSKIESKGEPLHSVRAAAAG